MSTRYLPKKSRKAISPVIATVILVAVAVVIAAAMAGFAGSLFGSYSNGPQVKIQTMSLNQAGDTGTITLSNSGNAADTVSRVSITVGSTTYAVAPLAGNATITANSNPMLVQYDLTGANNWTTSPFTAGQQVTATVAMQSGSTITQSLTIVS